MKMVKRESPQTQHLPRQYPDERQNNRRESPKSGFHNPRRKSVESGINSKENPKISSNSSLAAIPMAGAVLVGTCLGGPVGFLAGLKIGAFAGLGGSLLGYSTANIVEEHM
jgi:hypothetical protein